MLTSIAMTRGGPASAADWSETLDANTTAAYVTNPLWQPGSSFPDRAAQVAVDGNTQVSTEVSQLTVTPRFAVIRYDEEKNLDITTGNLTLAYQDKGERDQWNVSGLAQTDSTVTSELGQSGITSANLRHDSYNASVGYLYLETERLSWLLQSFGQITRYNSDAERFGLTGYSYTGAQLGPTWSFSERLDGSIAVETDEVSPQNGSTEKDYSATAQLKRKLSEQYSWHASAGVTRVDVRGSSGTPASGVFEVGVTRQAERLQWDLSAKRAVLPIGLGLLARQDTATLSATVALSERSTLYLAGNYIRTDPVSLFLYLAPGFATTVQVYSGAAFEQASAEWDYHLSANWSMSVVCSQGRARNYSVPEWADGNQVRLGVSWQSARL